jgi:hypothetical protein
VGVGREEFTRQLKWRAMKPPRSIERSSLAWTLTLSGVAEDLYATRARYNGEVNVVRLIGSTVGEKKGSWAFTTSQDLHISQPPGALAP